MFRLAENGRIGAFLRERIIGQYGSQREFCRAVLKSRGERTDGDALTNLANRVNQMLSGAKSIQISDLPVFTKLLHVTCEQLLSAGDSTAPEMGRVTNYAVASSDDASVWQDYFDRPDGICQFMDEYGRTVLDYALDFKNYPLLKYLTDRGLIWFVTPDLKVSYPGAFGAGTKLAPRPANELRESGPLRARLIEIAIEQRDLGMLEKMRARQIPSLHLACHPQFGPPDCARFYDEDMVRAAAAGGEEIVDYFSRQFTLFDPFKNEGTYVFPYLGQMIDFMLKDGRQPVRLALERAAAHDRWVYEQLSARLAEAEVKWKRDFAPQAVERLSQTMGETDAEAAAAKLWAERLKKDLEYFEDGNIVRFRPITGNKNDGIMTDLVRVTFPVRVGETGALIDEVNAWHDRITALCAGSQDK